MASLRIWIITELVLTLGSNLLQSYTFTIIVNKDILSLRVQMLDSIRICSFNFSLRKAWFVSRFSLRFVLSRNTHLKRSIFCFNFCISFSDVLHPSAFVKVLWKLLIGFCYCPNSRRIFYLHFIRGPININKPMWIKRPTRCHF